jgi:hypothetical protein
MLRIERRYEESLLYQEVFIKGCNLFYAVYDEELRIKIRLLDNHSKHEVPATRGSFSQTPTCGYFPDWVK